MNARKAIFILGGVIVLLLCAVVAVSLFALSRLEGEKNALKTSRAREARWPKKETGAGISESPEPEPEPEPVPVPELKEGSKLIDLQNAVN